VNPLKKASQRCLNKYSERIPPYRKNGPKRTPLGLKVKKGPTSKGLNGSKKKTPPRGNSMKPQKGKWGKNLNETPQEGET